jgi:hypothetical protein
MCFGTLLCISLGASGQRDALRITWHFPAKPGCANWQKYDFRHWISSVLWREIVTAPATEAAPF